jgi:integrase
MIPKNPRVGALGAVTSGTGLTQTSAAEESQSATRAVTGPLFPEMDNSFVNSALTQSDAASANGSVCSAFEQRSGLARLRDAFEPPPDRVYMACDVLAALQIDRIDGERWRRRILTQHEIPHLRIRGQVRLTPAQFDNLKEKITCSPSVQKNGNFYVRGQVKIGDQTKLIPERATGTRDRKIAEAYARKLQQEIEQELIYGPQLSAAKTTFAEAGLFYLKRPEPLHALDVWRVGELNKYIGNATLTNISEAWIDFMHGRCKGLAPATIDRFRAIAQAAMNYYAEAKGLRVLRLKKIKFKNTRIRFLQEEERERMISSYSKHVQPIILIYAFQGCRTQEALQLQWQHVNLDKRTIYFARTKSGETRTVKMHDRVFNAIKTVWEKRGQPTSGHVFLSSLGQPFADTRDYKLPGGNPLRSAHNTACKRADVSGFTVHDWRHHWASWCVMVGIDLSTIQRMGGWKSLRMVERYAAVSTDHMDAAMDRLN